MVGEIIFGVACFVTGVVLPKVLGLHKHRYEIVLHEKTATVGVPNISNYDDAYVTYKKCTLCGNHLLTISNGTDKVYKFDKEFVLTKISIIEKAKKEQEEKDLLATMEERLKTPEQREKERLEREALEAVKKEKEEKEREERKKEAMQNAKMAQGVGDILYVGHRISDSEDAQNSRKKKKMGKYRT